MENGTPAHPGPLTDLDKGPGDTYRKHTLLFAPSWDIPYFRTQGGFLGLVLGGWNVTPDYTYNSGAQTDVWTNTTDSLSCINCRLRPNLTGQSMLVDDWRKDPNLIYVNSGAFEVPPLGTYGNFKASTLPWTKEQNMDLTVAKIFPLSGEDVKLHLRADFFNLFNWVGWRRPGSGPYQMGRANATSMISYMAGDDAGPYPGREVQIGLRLVW